MLKRLQPLVGEETSAEAQRELTQGPEEANRNGRRRNRGAPDGSAANTKGIWCAQEMVHQDDGKTAETDLRRGTEEDKGDIPRTVQAG